MLTTATIWHFVREMPGFEGGTLMGWGRLAATTATGEAIILAAIRTSDHRNFNMIVLSYNREANTLTLIPVEDPGEEPNDEDQNIAKTGVATKLD